MRITIALLCFILATAAYAVTGTQMRAGEMRAAFFGATLDGEYSDGLAWGERFDREGRSVYMQDGARAPGRIDFRGDVICFAYEAGFSGGCFTVWRRSTNCFDFYGTDDAGRPYASRRQQHGGTGWTARAWRTDAASTCEAVPVS